MTQRERESAAKLALESAANPQPALDLYSEGLITRTELRSLLAGYAISNQESQARLIPVLSSHPEEWVRTEVAVEVIRWQREYKEYLERIPLVETESPLQPGVRVRLSGGYDACWGRPWWLNGRDYYEATFLCFRSRQQDRMPVAFIELDEIIDMTEGCGQRHFGKFALMKLLYFGHWTAEETVTIHIVESFPEDVAAFYKSHPFFTELESHAQCCVETNSPSRTTTKPTS